MQELIARMKAEAKRRGPLCSWVYMQGFEDAIKFAEAHLEKEIDEMAEHYGEKKDAVGTGS